MSMGLDSPMEALAINYLSHGALTAVNSVWAWVAFVTAAVSFWKIKSSIQYSTSPHHLLSLTLSSSPQPQTSDEEEPDDRQDEEPPLPSTTNCTSSKRYTAFCTLENRKSGKFSVYYYGQDNDDDDDNTNAQDEDVISSNLAAGMVTSIKSPSNRNNPQEEYDDDRLAKTTSTGCSNREEEEEEDWEAVLKMKTTEMGWYLYQDLTLLNGNVVQLWN